MTTETAEDRARSAMRWRHQFLVTIALLVGFAALVVVMMWLADGDDRVWQRRVYVFGAVQAIVFTAIGWLFGREVSRADAESARGDAAASKQEAKDEAARSAEAQREATAAQEKVNAVRAAAAAAAPARGGPQDVGGRRPAQLDLVTFIDELLS